MTRTADVTTHKTTVCGYQKVPKKKLATFWVDIKTFSQGSELNNDAIKINLQTYHSLNSRSLPTCTCSYSNYTVCREIAR